MAIKAHSSRIQAAADRGHFDFFSAHHFCSSLGSLRDPEDFKSLTVDSVRILSEFAIRCISRDISTEMVRSLQGFDGLLSCLLNNEGLRDLDGAAYLSFLTQIGERVLKGVFCDSAAWFKLKRLNCDSLLNDCFSGWKEYLDPQLRDHLLSGVGGWSSLDKQLRRREFAEPASSSPRGDSTSLYDYCPVALRSPIHTSAASTGEVSRIHIAYFRYLVSKRALARHIIFLVNAHNAQTFENLNDSNMTVINHTPNGRRDSRDSAASCESADYSALPLNSFQDLISSHCSCFFSAFGTGLLLQITNDVANALLHPPNEFLRLMIAMHPTEASAEGHAAVKKYLCSQLLVSLRSLISNRGNRSMAEDACMSFLMKAEMSLQHARKKNIDYRVVASLINAALSLTVSSWTTLTNRKKIKSDDALIAWLHYLADSNLVVAITSSSEGRKELRAIYREISAASVHVDSASGWEIDLAKRINCAPRMHKSDFRLLFTSANGLGITPVPVGTLTASESSILHVPSGSRAPTSPLNDESPSQDLKEMQTEARLLLVETATAAVRDEVSSLAHDIQQLQETLLGLNRTEKDHVMKLPASPDEKAEAMFKLIAS